ncbi:MAG: hypothetical protein AAFO69_20755 [Bacteroidota bacterium]
MMRKLIRLPYFLLLCILLVYACEDPPPEINQKDLTVAEVQSVYEALSSHAQTNGRQDTLGINWEDARYKKISVGDALLFPLENVTNTYVNSSEDGVLYPLGQRAYAFAYKKTEDDAVALELVQAVPTANTEAFTGFVAISDWNDAIKNVIYYENGVVVTPDEGGRTEGCTETFYYDCTETSINGEVIKVKCILTGSTIDCVVDWPELEPEDYDNNAGGSGDDDTPELCPHPELEGHWVECDQYICPFGYEAVEGEEGCFKKCPPGHTRDADGVCVGDFDCNVTSQRIKDAFPEASDATADTLARLLNEYGKDFGIDDVEELQHFLGQSNLELGGFNNLNKEENLRYSPERLIAVFPSRFAEEADSTHVKAADYSWNAVKLGNFAYANRNGNGNESSIDENTSVEDVTVLINRAMRELDKRKTKTKQAEDNIEDCIDHDIIE